MLSYSHEYGFITFEAGSGLLREAAIRWQENELPQLDSRETDAVLSTP